MTVKKPPPKISKAVRRILGACAAGQTLCVSYARLTEGAPVEHWFLDPSNCVVRRDTARRAAELLQPSQDGLLGPASSQTWRART